MKALIGDFNQEKVVRAFSVIVKPVVEPMDRFTALVLTTQGFNAGDAEWATASHRLCTLPYNHPLQLTAG